MEKKRSNKKLFAIIGGSVLAFVLTIALSVSITLAYFGETKGGSQTITLSNPVKLGADTAVTFSTEEDVPVVPTEWVKVNATAKIESTNTPSVLFAYVSTGSGIAVKNASLTATNWTKVGEVTIASVTYDLYAIASAEDTLTPIASGDTADRSITYTFQVDPDIENEDVTGTLTMSISVNFVRVQQIYAETQYTEGAQLSVTPSDYEPVLKAVDATGLGTATNFDFDLSDNA